MKKHLSIIAGIIFFTGSAYAQNSDSTSKDSQFSLNGYVDTYYSYNLNTPENGSNFGTTGVGRIFDGYHNQIALGLAQLKATYSTSKSEVVVDLAYGPNGELANFGNTGSAIIIKQAYLSTMLTDKLMLTAGQYGTHIGYELVDAPDNFHYSLSYLFGNGPFYHTGIKLDYAISEKVAVMAGVVNSWDAIFDNNKSKSITAQLALTPNDDFSAYINWIGGDEAPSSLTGDTVSAYKHMVDLTTSYSLNEKFTIGFNGAYGFSKYDTTNTNWGGAALYLTYEISDRFGIGLRSELFDDTEGTQYLGASYTGFTLTGSYTTESGAVMIKPEIRYDGSSQDIYYKGANNDVTSSQITVGIAFIGKF
ncbi:MAG: porin [Flavobacteriales bacterium]|nr:porin [Flavobacteriales bacterium]